MGKMKDLGIKELEEINNLANSLSVVLLVSNLILVF